MTYKHALWLTWFALAAGAVGFATAQVVAPSSIEGCVVVGAAPTYTALQRVAVTCNTQGQLRVTTTP